MLNFIGYSNKCNSISFVNIILFLPFQPETPVSGKRGKVIEDKPNKKFKASESGKGSHPTPPGPGRPKSKIAQVHILNTVNIWEKSVWWYMCSL